MYARAKAPRTPAPETASTRTPQQFEPVLSPVGNAIQDAGSFLSSAAQGLQSPADKSVDDIRNRGAVIGLGDRGDVVSDLQHKLTRLGYGVQATGIMGETTSGVLGSFQTNNRIAATGQLGPTTLGGLEKALGASVTVEELRAIAPDLDERTLRTYLPYLNASMAYADISNDRRKAAYLAQIAHESDHFRTFTEYASGADYEGRDDLGNTRSGDGVRYKGRGAIQLTGRANYRDIGKRLGVDFEKHPELLERPEYAFLASADYWKRHGLNRLADRNDFEGITDVINYYDPESRRQMRRAHHRRAKSALATNRHRHGNAPGTIGGEPVEDETPWWADEAVDDREGGVEQEGSAPDREADPTEEKRTQYAGWLESVLEGNSLAARDRIAKAAADYRSENGMASDAGDAETEDAGLMWQLADSFSATWTLAKSGDHAGVMARAHQAAERARELRDKGILPAERAQRLIDAMGARYEEAKSASAGSGAEAPLIDQHRMNHERNWAFCGIATLLTTLQGNGEDPGVDTGNRQDLARFASGIYTPGSGSSGAAMAARMREFGIDGARFGTGGNVAGITAMLAQGKPVPVGFVSMGGQVRDLPRPSARYRHLREGDRHEHTFGASGHWATVTGFEGPAENPTHFLVNDPDTGARIRMTRAELEKHTAAREGIWNIGY